MWQEAALRKSRCWAARCGSGLVKDDEAWIEAAREALLAEIAAEVAATKAWIGRDHLDPKVLAAMARVPRHAFVPRDYRSFAYDNRPLPIGQGQTISQPYMVAVMTDLAEVGPSDRLLEVGTGCGYQAAVLAELAQRVITLESVPELAVSAAERLQRLGYDNVAVQQADGSKGWLEAAPYQAILVTAAAKGRVPPALVEQLAPNGRLVVPVEAKSAGIFRASLFGWPEEQNLLLLTKDEAGRVTERKILPVAFVPLVEAPRSGEKA